MIYVQVACSLIGAVSALVVIIAWGDVALARVKGWFK